MTDMSQDDLEVVRFQIALKMGGWSKPTGLKYVASGRLESYLDGGVRKVTVRSIIRLKEELLAEDAARWEAQRRKLTASESAPNAAA
jgi:hypothetical protein